MNILTLSTAIGGEFTAISPYSTAESGGTGSWDSQTAELISVILSLLVTIAGIAFILYFIIGALTWVTAGGKTEQVDKAKSQMTNAATGLVAVVAAYGIAAIISGVLGINILSLAGLAEILPK